MGVDEPTRVAFRMNAASFAADTRPGPPAMHDQRRRLNFCRLSLATRLFHQTFDGNTASGGQLFDLTFVIRQVGIGDDLDVRHARTIVQFQETEATLRITSRPNPTLKTNVGSNQAGFSGVFD